MTQRTGNTYNFKVVLLGEGCLEFSYSQQFMNTLFIYLLDDL